MLFVHSALECRTNLHARGGDYLLLDSLAEITRPESNKVR